MAGRVSREWVGVLAAGVVTVTACATTDSSVEPPATSSAAVGSEADVPAPTGSVPGGSAPPASGTGDATGVVPEGFSAVTLRVTAPDGTVCEPCVWLADDAEERGRGLMGVTDLAGAVGMAFAYDRPSSGGFYMYRTVMPLSIAWFGPDGRFAVEADMAPCTSSDQAACPRYRPGVRYTLAVEVPQGRLAEHGLVPGATAELLLDTERDDCGE